MSPVILTWMVEVMVGTMEVGVGEVTRLVTWPGLTGTLGTEGRGEATVLGINMITDCWAWGEFVVVVVA